MSNVKTVVLLIILMAVSFTSHASEKIDIWADGIYVKICPADPGYLINTHQADGQVDMYHKAQKTEGPVYIISTTFSKVKVVCTGKSIEIHTNNRPAFVVIRDNLPKM